VANEIVDDFERRKSEVIVNVDYEKVYDLGIGNFCIT